MAGRLLQCFHWREKLCFLHPQDVMHIDPLLLMVQTIPSSFFSIKRRRASDRGIPLSHPLKESVVTGSSDDTTFNYLLTTFNNIVVGCLLSVGCSHSADFPRYCPYVLSSIVAYGVHRYELVFLHSITRISTLY